MNKFVRSGIVAASVFVATLVLAKTQEAKAVTRRVHASVCHSHLDAYSGNFTFGAAGQQMASGAIGNGRELSFWSDDATAVLVYCPAPSDSMLPHVSATAINVHGYSNSLYGPTISQACVKHFNADGTACGTGVVWGDLYGGAYGVGTSAWNASTGGMPYLVNYMSKQSSLFGFYIQD